MILGVFETREDFLHREDPAMNGITVDFLKEAYNGAIFDAIKDNKTNKGSFNCYKCIEVENGNNCEECERCNNIKDCIELTDSSECEDCSYMSDVCQITGYTDYIKYVDGNKIDLNRVALYPDGVEVGGGAYNKHN